MAIDIDGRAVLRAVLDDADAFPDIGDDVNKAARALVVRQLKAKTLKLKLARAIRHAIGGRTLSLIVDSMSDAETKGIVARLDKHHADVKTGTPEWRRSHIVALARAKAEPAGKPAKPARQAGAKKPKAPAPVKPKIERALSSKAMAARWDGKSRDEQA